MNKASSIDQEIIERIIKEVFEKIGHERLAAEVPIPRTIGGGEAGEMINPKQIPVGVSVRHMHICKEDFEVLYGPGKELTVYRDLYQPGEFAAKETVAIVGPKMRLLERIRILGPMRKFSQIEIAKTDSVYLGIDAPLRMSGDISGSASITVVGPKGVLQLKEGCIRGMRHIHMNPGEAKYFGLKNGDVVKVRVGGPSAVTFENVVIRISDKVRLQLHLDTDEGNVADINCSQDIEIIKE